MQLWRQGCQPRSLGAAELRGGQLQQTLWRRQVCIGSLGACVHQLHQNIGCFCQDMASEQVQHALNVLHLPFSHNATSLLLSSRLLPCLAQVPVSAQACTTVALHAAGGFNTAVEDFSALITLARNQGAIGGQNRGACRICGQLGHLTKQCRNHLSAHFQAPATAEAAAAAAASGKPLLPSIPAGPQAEDLSDLSSLSSDGSGSGSGSDSESPRRKRKHKVNYPCVAHFNDLLPGCANCSFWACAALHVRGPQPWRVRAERQHGDDAISAMPETWASKVVQHLRSAVPLVGFFFHGWELTPALCCRPRA